MRNNWIECKLGNILKLKNGFAFKSSKYIASGTPVIRIGDINDWVVDENNAKCVNESSEYDEYIVEKGDILIAMSGATTGKFGIYMSQNKAYQNQRVGNLKPHSKLHTHKEFIYYLLYALKRQIEKDAYGGAQPNISAKKIESLSIALPPLPEQRAIVAKIEQLFSGLDNGIANLKAAQDKLKIYRQAVLKKAFEGELTKEWREQQTDLPTADELLEQIREEREKYQQKQLEEWQQKVKEWEVNGKEGKKPTKPKKTKKNATLIDKDDIWNHPLEWCYLNLDQITKVITDGDHQAPPKSERGIPFITISNINGNNIDFASTFFVSNEYYDSLPKYRKPINGDVFYTVTGSFGIPVLIDYSKDFCFQRHIGLIRSLDSISKTWLYWLLQTRLVYSQAIKKATGTAQKTVGLASLRNFCIPLCSRKEQTQIVQVIESRLSVCDKVEETIKTNLQKADSLRQSILKKAFEGKLLTEAELEACRKEPDWEPAEKLLERIQKERDK